MQRDEPPIKQLQEFVDGQMLQAELFRTHVLQHQYSRHLQAQPLSSRDQKKRNIVDLLLS
jgi:hypothetical protein